MSIENQIIAAALQQKITPLKISALLNQARLESGNFNSKNKLSVWTRSGNTNPWGMQYPSQTLKFRQKWINGFFVDQRGTKWAKYKDVYASTQDRIYWERLKGIIPFQDAKQYFTELGKRNYFTDYDKGYVDVAVNLYNKNLQSDLTKIHLLQNSISIIPFISILIILIL